MNLRLPRGILGVRHYAQGSSSRPAFRVPDPLKRNPRAEVTELEDDLTFIHRPPPTAPTPYSTTLAPVSTLLMPAPSSENVSLPPSLKPPTENLKVAVTLTSEQVTEMRQLRREDPKQWTAKRLADRFDCTTHLVSKVAALRVSERKAKRNQQEAEHELIRDNWSDKKATDRAVRKKRREFW